MDELRETLFVFGRFRKYPAKVVLRVWGYGVRGAASGPFEKGGNVGLHANVADFPCNSWKRDSNATGVIVGPTMKPRLRARGRDSSHLKHQAGRVIGRAGTAGLW